MRTLASVVTACLIIAAVACEVPAVASSTLTVALPGGANWVAVSSLNGDIYLAMPESNSVLVLNGSSHLVEANITVGSEPRCIAIDQFTNLAYVTNYGSNTTSVIDVRANKVVATIQVGGNPIGVDLNPGSDMVYVADSWLGNVTVIDGRNDSVVSTIEVPGILGTGIAVDPTTNLIFVTYLHDVGIIDGSANVLTWKVRVQQADWAAAVPGDGEVLVTPGFTAPTRPHPVSVIGTHTASLISNFTVSNLTDYIGVDPYAHRAYLSDFYSGTVFTLDTTSRQVVSSIKLAQYAGPVGVDTVRHIVYVVTGPQWGLAVLPAASLEVSSTTTSSKTSETTSITSTSTTNSSQNSETTSTTSTSTSPGIPEFSLSFWAVVPVALMITLLYLGLRPRLSGPKGSVARV